MKYTIRIWYKDQNNPREDEETVDFDEDYEAIEYARDKYEYDREVDYFRVYFGGWVEYEDGDCDFEGDLIFDLSVERIMGNGRYYR